MTNVFVSHSTDDRAFVEAEIVTLLRNQDIGAWYSSDSIQSAQDWE
jgi:hypothetical protein